MMHRGFFVAGAVFAMIAVAAGAFGAHELAARVPAERLATFETGVRYQMYHAFALMVLSLAIAHVPGGLMNAAGWLFAGGIIVFSGTLYALTLGAPRWFGAITPIGGLAFLTGWLTLIVAVIRSR